MTVLEIGPGEGWYTELLAPTLATRGKLIDTMNDPNGPEDSRGTFYGQRFKAFLDAVAGALRQGADDRRRRQGAEARRGRQRRRGARDARSSTASSTAAPSSRGSSEIRKALKPGGILGIEEHRAPADADPVDSAKKGYVPEKWLIDQVEAAGFKLAGKSEVNANPKDTKDYAEGVWTLPPSLELGDKDKEKYVAIGESDRMTLKFVKAPEKTAAPAKAAPAKAAPASAPKK